MKKVRVITGVSIPNRSFVLNHPYPEGVLTSIKFLRGGQTGVFESGGDARYILTFQPEQAGIPEIRPISYTIIPLSEATSVTYIEQEVQEEEVPQARRSEA